MSPARWIVRKRDGGEMSRREIADLVAGYVDGSVADYQMSAWAMAVYLNGMTEAETLALTEAMLASGRSLVRPEHGPPRVDKHSTGGIGDKVSLVLAPLLAACGLSVPMLSGRGLGPTGGTLDKLESIPGFRTDLSRDEIDRVIAEVGCVITGTTEDLAPADRKLYALRDVTGTVSSIPLITASILSKKLAAGLDALVFDVKTGSGAFMKTRADARRLAGSLVGVATRLGVASVAWLTDMTQPLGHAVGNANEVDEALAALAGGGPADLREVTLTLAAELVVLAGRADSLAAARSRLERALDGGEASETFARMVSAQGGDLAAPRRLSSPTDVGSPAAGWVLSMNAEVLGQAVIDLGGGRRRAGDAIDPAVGLDCLVRLGDRVEAGQPLFRVRSDDAVAAAAVGRRLAAAVILGEAPPPPSPTVIERITAEEISTLGGEVDG